MMLTIFIECVILKSSSFCFEKSMWFYKFTSSKLDLFQTCYIIFFTRENYHVCVIACMDFNFYVLLWGSDPDVMI